MSETRAQYNAGGEPYHMRRQRGGHTGSCEGRPYNSLRRLRSGADWVECMECAARRAIQPWQEHVQENSAMWEAELNMLMRRGM